MEKIGPQGTEAALHAASTWKKSWWEQLALPAEVCHSWKSFQYFFDEVIFLTQVLVIKLYKIMYIPVVPHKAVAEVSKIGNL